MEGAIHSDPNPLLTGVVVTTIRPSQKTAHVESVEPTSLDWSLADLYVPTLFAYRQAYKSEDAYLQLSSRMKESLQEVLVPFFSFAGRWIAFPEGSNHRKLLCNDEGVPFIEAYVDNDMDVVVRPSLDFQAVPELQGYGILGMDFTQYKHQVPPDGLPPVFVQVTRFKCGGVVLAVTFSHMHADAKSFFNFMRAWSDLSRSNETAVKVDENRALAETDLLRSILEPLCKVSNRGADGNQPAPEIMRTWDMKAFGVRPSTIKSVKREAQENKDGPGFVSTVDCIVAHLWRSLARLPSSMLGGKEAAMSMIVEGRSMFYDPPLRDFLNGNVITPMVPTLIPTKELVEMPLASTACKIREQLETTRREDWHSSQRFSALSQTYRNCAVMAVTAWLKFPLYEMDFGIGNPIFATRVSTLWNYFRSPSFIGTAYIGPPIPNSPSSVATVCVFSFPEVLQALESDPSFLSFFNVQ